MAYTGLVGLPLLGLFTVLDVGEGLHAPPAIAGAWNVGPDTTSPCYASVTGAPLAIEQSGRYLHLRIGGDAVRAQITNGGFTAEWSERSGPCAGSRARLRAHVPRNADEAEQLVATLDAAPCNHCPTRAVTARRQR